MELFSSLKVRFFLSLALFLLSYTCFTHNFFVSGIMTLRTRIEGPHSSLITLILRCTILIIVFCTQAKASKASQSLRWSGEEKHTAGGQVSERDPEEKEVPSIIKYEDGDEAEFGDVGDFMEARS